METLLKLQRLRKNRTKYAYTIPERGVLYSGLGDWIILGGRDKFVCGGCLLLLKTLDVRYYLRSPLMEMRRMPPMQMTPFVSSKCGCELSFLKRNQSLFPNSLPRGRIHFHGLLFNVPLSLGDTRNGQRTIAYGDERTTRTLANLWGEGFVDATKTDGSPKLAFYISKYITKGGNETMFNAMRMLRISHGFPKETIVRGKFAEFLAERYANNQKPVKEWERKNLFLGMINRKTYIKK